MGNSTRAAQQAHRKNGQKRADLVHASKNMLLQVLSEASPQQLAEMERRMDTALRRRCGPCTACCEMIAVETLNKPHYQRCIHQCEKGCAIYPERPLECQAWSCLWRAGIGPEEARPDLALFICDPTPGVTRAYDIGTGMPVMYQIHRVFLDEKHPGWEEDDLLREFMVSAAQAHHSATHIHHTTQRDTTLVFPPPLTRQGDAWCSFSWPWEEKPRVDREQINPACEFPSDGRIVNREGGVQSAEEFLARDER